MSKKIAFPLIGLLVAAASIFVYVSIVHAEEADGVDAGVSPSETSVSPDGPDSVSPADACCTNPNPDGAPNSAVGSQSSQSASQGTSQSGPSDGSPTGTPGGTDSQPAVNAQQADPAPSDTSRIGRISVKHVGIGSLEIPPSGVKAKLDSGSNKSGNIADFGSVAEGSHVVQIRDISGYAERVASCSFRNGDTRCSVSVYPFSPLCDGKTCLIPIQVFGGASTRIVVLYTPMVPGTEQPEILSVTHVGEDMTTESAPRRVEAQLDGQGKYMRSNPSAFSSVDPGVHTVRVIDIPRFTESVGTCSFPSGGTPCSVSQFTTPVRCTGLICSFNVTTASDSTVRIAVKYVMSNGPEVPANPVVTPSVSPPFTASPTSGIAPLAVTFTIPREASMQHMLEFGDGTTLALNVGMGCSEQAFLANKCAVFKAHTYASPGTYAARLLEKCSGNILTMIACSLGLVQDTVISTATITVGSVAEPTPVLSWKGPLQFNGTDSYVSMTPVPDSNEFTIGAWVYFMGTSCGTIFSDADGNNGNDLVLSVDADSVFIRADKNGSSLLGSGCASARQYEVPLSRNISGTWNHMTWVNTGSASTVYLNGRPVKTIDVASNNRGYHNSMPSIGRMYDMPGYYPNGINHFKGSLANFVYYKTALSETQVADLYNKMPVPVPIIIDLAPHVCAEGVGGVGCLPPISAFSASPTSGEAPLTVSAIFPEEWRSLVSSECTNNQPRFGGRTFSIDWGDGTYPTQNGRNAPCGIHTYAEAGTYTIRAKIYDFSDVNQFNGSFTQDVWAGATMITVTSQDSITDLCPNILGAQAVVPNGYSKTNGNCHIGPIHPCPAVWPSTCTGMTIDACANIQDIQIGVPVGYTRDTAGNCANNTGVTIACTEEYIPVCGKKPIVCITTPCDPVPTTYGNKCKMKADGATLAYEGACRPAPQPPTPNPVPPKHPICKALYRDLSVGLWGDDVRRLQEFLREQGYFTTDPTGHFGSVTAQSVSRWQSSQGLPALGMFGPLSRNQMMRWCEGGGGGPQACTMEYNPVCGSKQVQCITTPCNPVQQTYSNACAMRADGATFAYEGACRPTASNPEADPRCKSWFDGCNTCSRSSPGAPAMCTMMACIRAEGSPTQDPYCRAYFTSSDDNQSPVISSFSGPTTLAVGATGTWRVQASDPENGTLTYSIEWGDEWYARIAPASFFYPGAAVAQSTTFTHSYARAGTYTVKMLVRDSGGKTAKATATVEVGSAPIRCPDLYKPVCGAPPRGICPQGVACAAVPPVTYSSVCNLNAAGATMISNGPCPGPVAF